MEKVVFKGDIWFRKKALGMNCRGGWESTLTGGPVLETPIPLTHTDAHIHTHIHTYNTPTPPSPQGREARAGQTRQGNRYLWWRGECG